MRQHLLIWNCRWVGGWFLLSSASMNGFRLFYLQSSSHTRCPTVRLFVWKLNGVFSLDRLAPIVEKLSKHFLAAQNHGRCCCYCLILFLLLPIFNKSWIYFLLSHFRACLSTLSWLEVCNRVWHSYWFLDCICGFYWREDSNHFWRSFNAQFQYTFLVEL